MNDVDKWYAERGMLRTDGDFISPDYSTPTYLEYDCDARIWRRVAIVTAALVVVFVGWCIGGCVATIMCACG